MLSYIDVILIVDLIDAGLIDAGEQGHGEGHA